MPDDIVFLLNGETERVEGEPPTRTLLDFLREKKRLTGTKEGCNEGDCGACTVLVTGPDGMSRAHNACILFLPQLHGKAVRTVEGIAGPSGELHPVQRAMVEHHGAQCGFCTPGIVASLAAAHMNGERDFDRVLAGNLCRCTGYAPIVRAARAAAEAPVPGWMREDRAKLDALDVPPLAAAPRSVDDLAVAYGNNPEARVIGGATDVGLWVTKRLQELENVIFLGDVAEMREIRVRSDFLRLGAMVPVNALRELMAEHHPHFAAMLARFGSEQVRNSGTIGGNIANGSPIGDGAPALIALGAELILRRKNKRRRIPLEDFFIDYGRQDLRPGEFIEWILIPRQPDRLRCYKISKRFDQDISALLGCFNIVVEDGHVASARIGFGGMAAIPARARAVEAALTGAAWNTETIRRAQAAFAEDFTPISDMRASAPYRLEAAQNLLMRYFLEDQGEAVNVLEVAP